MHIDLGGNTILVTGASRGIGREIALTLAKSGARIIVHYNRSEKEAEQVCAACGNGSITIQADLEISDEVSGLFHVALKESGRIHGLVNNAAVALVSPPESEHWLADWDQTLAVNARASAQLARLSVAHFKQEGGGRILNIVSRAAHRGDTEDYLAYAASKAALLALSKSLARAYGKDNIQSFAIAPGFVETDMAQEFIMKYGEAYVLDDLALTSLTQPRDIAQVTPLLFSGLMDHATGTTIDINAGSYIR